MSEIQISVRGLVEFVLRDGDIDNRGRRDVRQAMQEGARIHRMIQRRQGEGYQAEVPLSLAVPMGAYTLLVEGRADGVIAQERTEPADGQMELADLQGRAGDEEQEAEEALWAKAPTIDEIKGTFSDIRRLAEARPLHLAQAKCYAWFLAKRDGLKRVRIRLTYCSLETEEIRYFRYRFLTEELSSFFEELIGRYRRFSDYLWFHRGKMRASIRALSFPYPYRAGQKTLAGYVYRTIASGRKLFLEAPTGAGKTLAVLYPALKAIGEGRAERLFYMTARTIARTAPEQAFALLREGGLIFRTVTLTAKERVCVLEHPECNPAACPRARGHFSRVNDAIHALLAGKEEPDRETIAACAEKYAVCPFELSLDLSLFADGVICDYNYVFDPFVFLRRFFSESGGKAHLFLTDEAHNLLERGREMYSAALTEREIREAESRYLSWFSQHSVQAPERKELEKRFRQAAQALSALLPGAAPGEWKELHGIERLVSRLTGLAGLISELMSEDGGEFDDQALAFYFRIFRFLTIADYVDGHYLIYGECTRADGVRVKLFCVDPSERLSSCMERAASTILFSATFLPVQYYKALLGGAPEDYEAYAATTFPPDRFRVFIARDVTTRYQARGAVQYQRAAVYLAEAVSAKKGNYLAFFPSYKMLREVYGAFVRTCYRPEEMQLVVQQEQMTEAGREEFLSWFTAGTDADLTEAIRMEIDVAKEKSVVGFCVLGGIFSEGIDLKGDRLIGVIVMGTGLPQVSEEQELLRGYFDAHGRDGFDYAYRFPGMNKVLQAAGRLIRSEEDAGVLLLLDERFLQPAYRRLFPKEWKDCKIVTTETVKNELKAFWKGLGGE